jgi:hypothetical protein
LIFWWFGGWGTSDTRLARQKLGKKNTPQSWWPPLPYGRHGALLRHCRIDQLANMLHDNLMSLKLENIIVFLLISYFKAQHIVTTPCLHVCKLPVGGAESIILSTGSAESMMLSACPESMLLSVPESMMLSACAESLIVSVPPAESMILSAPFDHVIMLTAAQ